MAQNPKLSFLPYAPSATNKQQRKNSRGDWPSGKWLTHRFKQAVKKIKQRELEEMKQKKKKQLLEERWTKRGDFSFFFLAYFFACF